MEENNGERERARVLAALAAVDAVVVFDEPTSLEVILATRPEVVVKGGDRAVDAVVGVSGVVGRGRGRDRAAGRRLLHLVGLSIAICYSVRTPFVPSPGESRA